MRPLLFTMLICCTILFVSCNNSNEPADDVFSSITLINGEQALNSTAGTLSLSDEQKATLTQVNEISIKIFTIGNKEYETDNLVISPLSLSTCMAIVTNGASGATRSQLLDALWNGSTIQQVNSLYSKLTDEMTRLDNQVKFSSRNSIWIANGIDILGEFEHTITGNYHADIAKNVPFGNRVATDAISIWTEDATNGIIKDFGKNFDNSNILSTVINALYFKGLWSKAFDERATAISTFTNLNGLKEDVQMMTLNALLDVYSDENLTMVELPYGQRDKYYMELLLPTTTSITEFISSLTFERLQNIDENKHKKQVIVRLPRFNANQTVDCASILHQLGVNNAFNSTADFSHLSSSKGLRIGGVLQNTSLNIDENGTEAASATAVIIDGAGGQESEISFNRPFAFLIRERESGIIIIAAKIASINSN